MIRSRAPYQDDHDRSAKRADRVSHKPVTLRALHRWCVDQYALEAPGRLHDRDVADDGSPDHTGEFKSYVGLSQQKEPNDWRAVACRVDVDGFYITPMRAAIARIGDPERRQLLGGLACNLLTPLDVTRAQGIPDTYAGDVMFRSLQLLWSVYADRPLPRRSISDAQADAEAAA